MTHIENIINQLNSTYSARIDPKPISNFIIKAHAEPHRKYHTWDHICSVLKHIDSISNSVFETNAPNRIILNIKIAALFHDIVWNPIGCDNEVRSAIVAENMLPYIHPIPYEDAKTFVKELILATALHIPTTTKTLPYQCILIDADLADLGADYETIFLFNNQNIKKEYLPHFTEEKFDKGRRIFFESLLKRDYIFHTNYGKTMYEQNARYNIERFLNEDKKNGTSYN